jgi:uncharacterized protein
VKTIDVVIPPPGRSPTRGGLPVLRIALAGLAAMAVLVPACRGGTPTARVHTAAGVVSIALEVAATPEAMHRGLMYRTALADGTGMLFVFPDDAEHSFWMKNTLIPLDMLFLDAGGRVVGIHANAKPLSTLPITVGVPSRYVIEVPGGWAAGHGIAPGDRVELPDLPAP